MDIKALAADRKQLQKARALPARGWQQRVLCGQSGCRRTCRVVADRVEVSVSDFRDMTDTYMTQHMHVARVDSVGIMVRNVASLRRAVALFVRTMTVVVAAMMAVVMIRAQ